MSAFDIVGAITALLFLIGALGAVARGSSVGASRLVVVSLAWLVFCIARLCGAHL